MHPGTARSHPTTGLCEISPNDASSNQKKECRNAQDQDIVSRGHRPGRFRRISRGRSCQLKRVTGPSDLGHDQIRLQEAHGTSQPARFPGFARDVLAIPLDPSGGEERDPSEGNWAGFWGNDAIDQKLHDIGTSGPVVLEPDYSKLKVVGLTPDVAESYAPMNITVSYAGQDGTPKPFLMIINWIKVGKDWKIASEIILPVPPAPAAKG